MSGQIVPLCVNGNAMAAGAQSGEALNTAEGLLPMSVGQQLRAARTRQGLSAADIAKSLKLSPHQVEALEADDWSRLPCNTIIRGFVRNYARLLGLDTEPLMAMLDRLQMPHAPELEMPVGTNVRVPQEGGVERRDFLRVFSGLAVLGLAVSAYFFMPQDWLQSAVFAVKTIMQSPAKAVPAAASASAPLSAPLSPSLSAPATASVSAPLAAPASVPAPASEPATPAPALANAAPPAPAASNPPAAALPRLKFVFGQPSWVEVRDRSGEVIFSQLCQAGSEREIDGQAPFALVIGNASHVTLQYQGKPVDLSKRSKEDVARVTVE